MRVLKKAIASVAAAMSIGIAAPAFGDPGMDLSMREKKINLTLSEDTATVEKTIVIPKSSGDEGPLYDNIPWLVGSKFGFYGNIRYKVSNGIELKNPTTMEYNGCRLDVISENVSDLLRRISQSSKRKVPEKLESLASELFTLDELNNGEYGGFTIQEWYNIYKATLDNMKVEEVGNLYNTHGVAGGEVDARSELYTSHEYRKGKDLMRHEYGTVAYAKGNMALTMDANVKFGEGMRFPNNLARFFGTTLDLVFKYDYFIDVTASEGHQFSYKTNHGRKGIGFTYEEYFRAKGNETFTLNVSSTEKELLKMALVNARLTDNNIRQEKKGNSALVYHFQAEDIGPLWYYAMLGMARTDYNYLFYTNQGPEYLDVLFDGSIRDDSRSYWLQTDEPRTKIDIHYALLGGFNLHDFLHGAVGFTTYPYDQKIGALWTLSDIVSIKGTIIQDIFETRMRMEAFMPLFGSQMDQRSLQEYFKESTMYQISPFPVKVSNAELLKGRAYSKMRGTFLFADIDDRDARFGVLLGTDKMFAEGGLEINLSDNAAGINLRTGFKNVNIMLRYSPKIDDEHFMSGHSGTLGFFGEFNDYFFNFLAKGLWAKRGDGILYVNMSEVPKDAVYVTGSFGGIW